MRTTYSCFFCCREKENIFLSPLNKWAAVVCFVPSITAWIRGSARLSVVFLLFHPSWNTKDSHQWQRHLVLICSPVELSAPGSHHLSPFLCSLRRNPRLSWVPSPWSRERPPARRGHHEWRENSAASLQAALRGDYLYFLIDLLTDVGHSSSVRLISCS